MENNTHCQNQNCCAEIQRLNIEICELACQEKELKEKYYEALISNLKKDIKIDELNDEEGSKRYSEFKGHLSEQTLRKLRLCGNTPRNDSTFILITVHEMFRDDLKALQHMTVSGRAKKVCDKKVAFPEAKLNVIESLFSERMAYIPIYEGSARSNKSNVHKLVKDAIINISNSI